MSRRRTLKMDERGYRKTRPGIVVRETRRNIARVKTILRQREMQA